MKFTIVFLSAAIIVCAAGNISQNDRDSEKRQNFSPETDHTVTGKVFTTTMTVKAGNDGDNKVMPTPSRNQRSLFNPDYNIFENMFAIVSSPFRYIVNIFRTAFILIANLPYCAKYSGGILACLWDLKEILFMTIVNPDYNKIVETFQDFQSQESALR